MFILLEILREQFSWSFKDRAVGLEGTLVILQVNAFQTLFQGNRTQTQLPKHGEQYCSACSAGSKAQSLAAGSLCPFHEAALEEPLWNPRAPWV